MTKTSKDFISDLVNATINGDAEGQEAAFKAAIVPKTAAHLGIATPEVDAPEPEANAEPAAEPEVEPTEEG